MITMIHAHGAHVTRSLLHPFFSHNGITKILRRDNLVPQAFAIDGTFTNIIWRRLQLESLYQIIMTMNEANTINGCLSLL